MIREILKVTYSSQYVLWMTYVTEKLQNTAHAEEQYSFFFYQGKRDTSTIPTAAKNMNGSWNPADLESDRFYSALHQLCVQVTSYLKGAPPLSSDTRLWHNLSHW